MHTLMSVPFTPEQFIEFFDLTPEVYLWGESVGILRRSFHGFQSEWSGARDHDISDFIEFAVAMTLGWPVRPAKYIIDDAEAITDIICAAWERAEDQVSAGVFQTDFHRRAYIFAATAFAAYEIPSMSKARRIAMVAHLGRILGVETSSLSSDRRGVVSRGPLLADLCKRIRGKNDYMTVSSPFGFLPHHSSFSGMERQ